MTALREILIIEDSPTTQLLLSTIVEGSGFKPILATDGDEAMRMLRFESDNLCLVLLDLNLPEIDGISLLGHIRSSLPQLPVFVITGSDDPDDENTVLKLGTTAFIKKPIEKNDLKALIAQHTA